jgi:hypothetical protein
LNLKGSQAFGVEADFSVFANKASQNRQQAGWTRFTRLCWQAL